MADNVIPMPIPSAPSAPTGPQGIPLPGGQMQIMLPAPLQDVMQQFPDVLKRLAAVEARPVGTSAAPTKLVAAFAYLAGFSTMAVLVWLWFYAAIIFRL